MRLSVRGVTEAASRTIQNRRLTKRRSSCRTRAAALAFEGQSGDRPNVSSIFFELRFRCFPEVSEGKASESKAGRSERGRQFHNQPSDRHPHPAERDRVIHGQPGQVWGNSDRRDVSPIFFKLRAGFCCCPS